ncbi:DUF6339 family protein [Streptomyces sp. E5N91]|uniref:DUF6339 family protein n=1 Tax=Streptomyces sp. E5N91 TaxID=1851996 RepID=UPI000EF62036|nr:DUF6339 family protein [Streptomyces sp. E5N91]
MIDKPHFLPARFGLLSATAADLFLTEDLLKGVQGHGGVDLDKVVESLPEDDVRWEVEPIRDLVDDARYQFRNNRTDADGWLAPRLHATLRLTRREAADGRFWTHLGLAVAPDYVAWRHRPTSPKEGKAPRINSARFKGAPDRQCFSRLWWAAEMFRNGEDYAPVVTACSNQDLIHNALRMDLIDHRPTAQALVRILERGIVSSGREINGLMTAINTAGATLVYEALAPDEPRAPEALRQWIAEAESAPPAPRHDLPVGPDEERVPEQSVAVLADYLAELFEEAPIRGRSARD